MCRMFALTSDEPMSPMVAIQAIDVMREGHDGSGVGIFLALLGVFIFLLAKADEIGKRTKVMMREKGLEKRRREP